MTKIVRISKNAYDKLNKLEVEIGASKQVIIEQALDKLMRENLIKRANKAYEKLKSNPQAWQEELEERATWESTITDGLEDV